MIEQINSFNYKPVVIGCRSLDIETKRKLHCSRFLDINVYTDSDELQGNMMMSGAGVVVDTLGGPIPSGSLYYMTKEKLPFTRKNGIALMEMDIDYPGDIYMSPQMDSFYFSGVEKFGTLISMVYGIRSLISIDRGILGLHSALLYDKEKRISHLLVGRNRIGKSSISQTIEDMSGRFVLVSDDWNEINLQSQRLEINPVSTVFSLADLGKDYELAFTSFNKHFYLKHNLRPLPFLSLGKIIEVYKDGLEIASNNFLPRTLIHVPSFNQNIREEDFACNCDAISKTIAEIERRKNAILQGYQQLISVRPVYTITNNPDNNTLEEISKDVLNILIE